MNKNEINDEPGGIQEFETQTQEYSDSVDAEQNGRRNDENQDEEMTSSDGDNDDAAENLDTIKNKTSSNSNGLYGSKSSTASQAARVTFLGNIIDELGPKDTDKSIELLSKSLTTIGASLEFNIEDKSDDSHKSTTSRTADDSDRDKSASAKRVFIDEESGSISLHYPDDLDKSRLLEEILSVKHGSERESGSDEFLSSLVKKHHYSSCLLKKNGLSLHSPSDLYGSALRSGGHSRGQQSLVQFDDHFTLSRPSSSVNFGGEAIHIYDLRSSQVQMSVSKRNTKHLFSKMRSTYRNHVAKVHPLERASMHASLYAIGKNMQSFHGLHNEANGMRELPEETLRIQIKDVQYGGSGRRGALRLTYTIVAIFCMASFFVFSMCVILFLFMNVVVEAGLIKDKMLETIWFLGSLFAIPVFLYGFSSLLTVWQFFISETWNDFPFLRTVWNGIDDVIIEGVTFTMMLGIPMTALVISLFLLLDNWWAITIYAWFISVCIFFLSFTFVVVCCEIEAAWLIVLKNASRSVRRSSRWSKIKFFVGHAIKRTQEKHFCGYKNKTKMRSRPGMSSRIMVHSHKILRKWYTIVTQWKCLSSCFEAVVPAEPVFSIDDVVSSRPFATKNNWSIEKGLCANNFAKNVVVVKGPGALTKNQIICTMITICISIIGLLLIVQGLLRWFHMKVAIHLVFAFLILICCFPNIMSMWRFLLMYQKHSDVDDSVIDVGESDGIYRTFETYRVSRPTKKLRYFLSAMHLCCWYLYPLITLIVLNNYPILLLFIGVASWSMVRYWFDPVVMLHYRGDLEHAGRNSSRTEADHWKDRSRICMILLKLSRASSTKFYARVFLTFVVAVFTFSLQGASTESDGLQLTPQGDFLYSPQPNLRYPTCSGFDLLNHTETTLIDYMFLSTNIYKSMEDQIQSLDQWFGPGVAKVDGSIIQDFKKTLEVAPELDVNYEVVSFGNKETVIIIRGTSTPWEYLVDAEIWMPIFLLQTVQRFLPLGKLFDPILSNVIKGMGFIKAEILTETSLYVQTMGLVNYIKQTPGFNQSSISITGHSLGGGIALITGAQTKIPAISFAGPNILFSRKSFKPVLDLDTINSLLFNVLPERDIVSKIDKPGILTQQIACTTDAKDFGGCHMPKNILCELMYSCGSFNRPILCDCVTKLGYPEPQQVSGNKSIAEVCGTT